MFTSKRLWGPAATVVAVVVLSLALTTIAVVITAPAADLVVPDASLAAFRRALHLSGGAEVMAKAPLAAVKGKEEGGSTGGTDGGDDATSGDDAKAGGVVITMPTGTRQMISPVLCSISHWIWDFIFIGKVST